jgi:hypothetical protein
MSKILAKGNYPNESQVCLLKAALSNDLKVAEAYFEKWLSLKYLDNLDVNHPDILSHIMDSLDIGSQRLIPLLHENLRESSHRYLPYLKGYKKKTWFRNQQIGFYIKKLQAQLAANNIPSIVFKGLDYAANYYPSIATRPMNDGDLLIPLSEKEKFFKLKKEGRLDLEVSKYGSEMKKFVHAAHLEYPCGVDIDLHWNVFPEYSSDPDLNDIVWANKKVDDKGNLRLSETLSLFLALTHGKNFDPVTPIRWVSDSVLILRKSKIDWDLFYELTEKLKFKPFIINAVKYLKEEFEFDIPHVFLEKLNLLTPTPLEKKYYESISIDIRAYGIFSLLYLGTKRRFIFYNLFLKDDWVSIWHYLFDWYKSRFWVELDNLKKKWIKH